MTLWGKKLKAALIGLCLWGGTPPLEAGLYNPQTFTLANGLKVVVIENHRANVVGQFLWFKVGANDDPAGKSGLAHYLEHLRFKGPRGTASAEMTRLIEEVGGLQNASTSHDFTNYYQIVATPHLELVMKLEAERMRDLQCLPEQAKTELNVILEERRMRIDNDPLGRYSEVANSLYYRAAPRRLPMIGWPHEIKALTLDDARAFYRTWYAPGNAVLVLVGDITLDKAKELAKKHYGAVPARPLPTRNRLKEPFEVEGHIRFDMPAEDIQAPYFISSYRAPSYQDEKGRFLYAAQVFETMLSSSPTGFLYQELVEKEKVATFASANYDVMAIGPTELCFILQPTPKTPLPQLEASLEKALTLFLETGITQENMDRAKARMISTLIFTKDSALSGNDVGYSLVMGLSLDDVENWEDNIKAVTLDQVKELARLALSSKMRFTGTLVAKGPTPKGASS
ncbi:MAG: M16 family metallopeptidase [Alphaproteobacteria bacterium]|jgi:zinc protease|nr:insulinase family protein [Alphaproteobacteria bacterium]